MPGVDPLFTDEDADEILTVMEWEASLCPGCGQPKHEAYAPENQWLWQGYTVQCHAEAAASRAMKKLDVTDGVKTYAVLRR